MAEGAPLLREYTLIAYRGFESLLLRHLNKSASLAEAFLFRGRAGGLIRTLWFDKLCLEQSLDAKPLGAAPRRGESGEGSAARINPSFSAINKTARLLRPFLFIWEERGLMRALGFDQTQSVWHRALEARSPQGQNKHEPVLSNPSLSTINGRARPVRALSFMGLCEI